MFNPITASQEIKDAFTDYITTTFDFADPDYADELKKYSGVWRSCQRTIS